MPKKSGFTLIELLIAISIIAVLSVIGLTAYNGVQARARDTKRTEATKQLVTLLEAHYSERQVYPTTNLTWVNSSMAEPWISGLDTGNLSGGLPRDPVNIGALVYGYVSDGNDYCLQISNETNAQGNENYKTGTNPWVLQIGPKGPDNGLCNTLGGFGLAMRSGDRIQSSPSPSALSSPAPSSSPSSSPLSSPSSSPLSSPSSSPAATYCSITSASWNSPSSTVVEGTNVNLNVQTSSNCANKQLKLDIYEDDLIGDDYVTTLPFLTLGSINSISVPWTAVYQQDLNGLGGNPEYYFIATITGEGASVASSAPLLTVSQQPSIHTTPPNAPTNVAATAANAQATITWSAPSSDGGSAITHYFVYTYTIYNHTFIKSDTVNCPCSNLSTTITDLTNGTAYYFVVQGVNSVGLGEYSAYSNIVTPSISQPTYKRVFLTNTPYTGKLFGLDGADQRCQNEADGRRLGGAWKAWLSDSHTSAASRLSHSTVPYQLLDGSIVAKSWDDLTDGILQHAINIDSLSIKQVSAPSNIWTATAADGRSLYSAGTCLDWTSDSSSDKSIIEGQYLSTDNQWTESALQYNDPSQNCNNTYKLYCFEQ